MKFNNFFAAFILISGIAFSQVEFKSGSVEEILSLAKDQNKPVMVDVTTDWCVWCVELDNLVYTRPEVYEYANANLINYRIDAEKGEGITFAKKYDINAFPTVIFLEPGGAEIDRLVGYFPAEKFKTYMIDYTTGRNTLKDLESKLKSDPDNIETLYKLSEKKLFDNKLEEARELSSKVIEKDPSNTSGRKDDAEFLLGYTSHKDEIAQKLEEFIISNPESDVLKYAYLEITNVYQNILKDNSKAEKWIKAAMQKYPGDEAAVLAYSRYLNSLARAIGKSSESGEDDYKKALDYIAESLTYAKNSTAAGQAYYWQSELNFKLKEYSKSLESINKAIEIFDNDTYREQKEKIEKQFSK